MPFKSGPRNFKLKIALIVMLVGGFVLAVMGQNYGAHRVIPNDDLRIELEILPFAFLTIGLLFLARSRTDLIVLLAFAVPITLFNGLLFDVDEFGFVHCFVPIFQGLLGSVALLVVILIRALWSISRKGKEDAAQASPNTSTGPHGQGAVNTFSSPSELRAFVMNLSDGAGLGGNPRGLGPPPCRRFNGVHDRIGMAGRNRPRCPGSAAEASSATGVPRPARKSNVRSACCMAANVMAAPRPKSKIPSPKSPPSLIALPKSKIPNPKSQIVPAPVLLVASRGNKGYVTGWPGT
jgi:hypothetical protein